MTRILAVAAALVALVPPAQAEDFKRGAVTISCPWVRATTVSTTAAYFSIIVNDSAGDTLISASSTAAGRVELHTVVHDSGVMRMRPLGSIVVARDRPAHLRPGSDHLMLLDLKGPLKAGERLPIVLNFARAGAIVLSVPVVAGNAPPAPALPAHEHMRR